MSRNKTIDLAKDLVNGGYVALFHVNAAEDTADGSHKGLRVVARGKTEFGESRPDVVIHGFEFAVVGKVEVRRFVRLLGSLKEFVTEYEGSLR